MFTQFREGAMSKTAERRQQLKNALISAAERTIENHGLGGLKARALAYRVGCAVGAIYNVVTDLDDLVFEVNSRTLTALERHLAARQLLAQGVGPRLAVGWVFGAGVSVLAMLASAILDLPTGATVVCAFGLSLLALGFIRIRGRAWA